MNKTRFVAAFLGMVGFGLASVMGGSPAGAAPPQKNGCPSGWKVKTVAEVLAVATPGFESAIMAADENHDGSLCFKLLPQAIPLFEPTFLFSDNAVPNPH